MKQIALSPQRLSPISFRSFAAAVNARQRHGPLVEDHGIMAGLVTITSQSGCTILPPLSESLAELRHFSEDKAALVRMKLLNNNLLSGRTHISGGKSWHRIRVLGE